MPDTLPTDPAPPPPAVVLALPTAPTPASKAVAVGGAGLGGALIYLIDRLLHDGGASAAETLTRLSPLLGPAWANWPLLSLVCLLAWFARDKWNRSEHMRALEAVVAANNAASMKSAIDQTTASVGSVVRSVGELRGEVSDLRDDLREHSASVDLRFTTTDARLASTDTALREFVRGEITPLADRVVALETKRRARPSKSSSTRP